MRSWAAVTFVVGCLFVQRDLAGSSAATQGGPTPVDSFRIVRVYPHDPGAYTQGLVYRDGYLYESTGRYGRSSVRKVKLETGDVLQQHRLGPQHFGEGLTEWQGQLFQLTWQSQLVFVYDKTTFAVRRTMGLPGEGWGLTHDGRSLISTDGSEWLRFHDPGTLRETRRVRVTDRGRPVRDLNELEYIDGQVYANVWQTDRIARIDPATGTVARWIDLSGLLSSVYLREQDSVLNGIAYDTAGRRLFVTGKLWPKLFEIAIVRRPG